MIVILNFGSQVAHLIARRIRDQGVYSEIIPHDTSAEKIKEMKPNGIVLSGGPSSVYEENAPKIDNEIFNLGIPILGICYGLQLIGKEYGEVESHNTKEYGKTILQIKNQDNILKGLKSEEQVWMSHGDSIKELKGFEVLASTPNCKFAALSNKEKNIYGVQFHPEVAHTLCGEQILNNFIFDICNAEKDFDIANLKEKLIQEIKETVGEDEVLMGVSGGVDSTVAAVLIHEAIGKRLHCVFIDHGLMRKNEKEEVDNLYKNNCNFENYYSVDASELFLKNLKGISDPEEKRKIIGHAFIETFDKKTKELEDKNPRIKFLGQGTIYPDRIESAVGSKSASKIKSHHNVTLPDDMKLKVIEPLKDFYKDGVRKLGKELGIPAELLNRHPFPGPGLGIRILGEVDIEKVEILQEADFIFIEELKKSGYYAKTWQALAALLPVKTVGVMGDARTYEYMLTLRAVTSTDAMTADWAKLPYDLLEKISTRIINEVEGINRVAYDISQKPPATIEYE